MGTLSWGGETLALALPEGTARPPLIRLTLWEPAAAQRASEGDAGAAPLASAEVELPEIADDGGGSPGGTFYNELGYAYAELEVQLPGTLSFGRDVQLSFLYSEAPAGAAAAGGLTSLEY